MPRDSKLELALNNQKMENEIKIKELELQHQEKEKEMEYRHQEKVLELQIELKNAQPVKSSDGQTPKLKLQVYDIGKDDILCFLGEFESIASQMGWSENLKVLQMRTLLIGEAREVSQQVTTGYEDLRKALINRFGKRPADYFSMLEEIKRRPGETYRGLMSRIDMYLTRFLDGKDPSEKFREEFFMKALSPQQSQWIRRNRNNGSVIDAAEDYIVPDVIVRNGAGPRLDHNRKFNNNEHRGFRHEERRDNIRMEKKAENITCFKCNKKGHYASRCPPTNQQRPVTYLVNNRMGDQLIHIEGQVNGVNLSFVKDTGAEMTLIREEFVDPSCILEGQRTTLYTAIGQPFSAKLAVVDLSTPYFKGHTQVGVVSNLAADALLGLDVMNRVTSVNVITRQQAKTKAQNEVQHDKQMVLDDVHPRNILEEDDTGNERNVDSHENNEDFNLQDNYELVSPINLKGLSSVSTESLILMQRNDASLAKIREKAVNSESEVDDEFNAFYYDNSVLKRKWKTQNGAQFGTQIVVPEQLRNAILKLGHERPLAGHLGVEKTKARIMAAFYWPGIGVAIRDHCHACDTCQKTSKRVHQKAPMMPPPIIHEPFRKIAMDIVGPLPRTQKGNTFMLTIVDDATRYPEVYPLPSCDAQRVATCLIDLFSRVGFPKIILTDQGTNFTSALLKQLYDELNIKGITTTPYHPAANGRVERFNGTLKSMLKKLCETEEKEWDELIPYVLFAYREVPHEETGYSPFELLYGWPVRGPIQLLKSILTGEEENGKSVIEHVVNIREKLSDMASVVQDNLSRRQVKVKQWYDKDARHRQFDPGDEVLILLPTDTCKLNAHWKGPYRVVAKVNDLNYRINVGGRRGIVTYHVNLLRKYNRAAMVVHSNVHNEDSPEMTSPLGSQENLNDVRFGQELTRENKEQLRQLCDKFKDVFTSTPGKTSLVHHSIRTTSETPIALRPYRIPYAKRTEVKCILDDMLKQGLIRPSVSPYSSPIVLINKPDGSIRLCVDYRKLNEVTLSDQYPIPRVDELFEKLGDSNYLSSVDLTKGYYQIPLSEDSQEKSAFITPFGLYEFTVLPFGMKTAPATCARLIDKVLSPIGNVVAYFDDIVIYSNSFTEHLKHLEFLFMRLRECGLTVRPSKCELACSELKCLGHIVGKGCVKPDPKKVKAMIEYPLPTNKKELRGYMGMIGYYRNYIQDFAGISAPLSDMLKKECPNSLKWSEPATHAFKSLKTAMTGAPVLKTADFSREFILQTDASDYAIGAVLSQDFDGHEHPIAFLSRKLLPRERNYSTIEKECLSIVWSVESLSYYLTGVKFTIETDHNPLSWLNKVKDKNQRLLRWSLVLQPYDYTICYRSGRLNKNADCMSRIP